MKLGVTSINITPQPGLDLGGYAARIQPSTGILDPLFVKALYFEDGDQKLLWVHADVIGLTGDFVTAFRDWTKTNLNLDAGQVLLSATHTHAAPVTIPLTGCGQMNDDFLKHLRSSFENASREAMAKTQDVTIVIAQAECHLAIDRRNKPSAHTDPIVTAIGFKRGNDFIATILNYGMHPTALGASNRAISTDWCGYAANFLTHNLPGNPITLTTNGACGNINPPKQHVNQITLRSFGENVAQSILHQLKAQGSAAGSLKLAREIVPMPMDAMSLEEIDRVIDENLAKKVDDSWAIPWKQANEKWRETQKQLVLSGRASTLDMELFAFSLGPVTALAINGEIFTRFTDTVRRSTHTPYFTITYANSAFGYVPTKEAYAEGGYEVEQAHFFYNTFRPKAGALEMLTEKASQLVRSL